MQLYGARFKSKLKKLQKRSTLRIVLIFSYILETELSGSNIKKSVTFSYISGDGDPPQKNSYILRSGITSE